MEQDIEDGKIICEVCKKRFKIITPGHLAKHDMTMNEYKQLYPEAKLSSYIFKTSTKYGKTNVFKDEIKKEPVIEDSITDDIPPEVEELIINDLEMQPIPEDKIGKQTGTVLNLIKMYFPKTEKNYFIRKINLNGSLLYEFITDFADPEAKIMFDFPKTFWHNDHHTNAFRNRRIKDDGWKIFTSNSSNPDFNKLKLELEQIY